MAVILFGSDQNVSTNETKEDSKTATIDKQPQMNLIKNLLKISKKDFFIKFAF
jgi:hypothetical protein